MLVERETVRVEPIVPFGKTGRHLPTRPKRRLRAGSIVDERSAVEEDPLDKERLDAFVVAEDGQRDRLADEVGQLIRLDRERRGARSGPRRGEQSDDEGEKEFFS